LSWSLSGNRIGNGIYKNHPEIFVFQFDTGIDFQGCVVQSSTAKNTSLHYPG